MDEPDPIPDYVPSSDVFEGFGAWRNRDGPAYAEAVLYELDEELAESVESFRRLRLDDEDE